MYPHQADQIYQRSQVSRIALWWSSLNVFVFDIVFVFVFVFVIVFFLVRSCVLITLIKCLKGHRSLASLYVCQSVKYCEWVSEWVSDWVTRSPIELFWTAKKKNPMKCKVPVHVWNVGNTKGPVKGGACCSIEDARDAANLTLENVKIEERKRPARSWDCLNLIVFPMDCMESIIASEGKVIHCIVARSRSLSVAPEDREWFCTSRL